MSEIVVRFIGTGDSESLNYYNTNMLVSTRAKNLLVDCGWTAKQALRDHGLTIKDIDAIFITHVHGDHVFGLERFGFESRYVHGGHRIKLYVPESVLYPLWHECLKGCMGYSGDGKNDMDDFFDVIPVSERFFWEGLDFEVFPTTHTVGKPSFGIRLPYRFTFTSDTNAIPELSRIVQDDPYVFHDVYLSGDSHPAHATAPELRRLYSPELLRRIYAIHYGDDIIDQLHKLEGFAGWVRQGELFKW